MPSCLGDQISDTPPQMLFSVCCAPRKLFDAWLVLISNTHPKRTTQSFLLLFDFSRFLRVSASGVWHREAAVLMVPLTSCLICSSSPRAHKKTRLFVFCQLGHTVCFVCWPLCLCRAEFWVLVLLASLRPACSLRCICSSPHAFVSVRTKLQQRPASKPAAHQHYKSLQSSPFLFVFLAIVQLCYFAFCLFIPLPSVSALLASPTSIKFHLLSASCSYVLVLFYGFASLCRTL